MKDGQEEVYYITGDNLDMLKSSPQLEGFRARGVEVLLMTDPIDEFWLTSVPTYKEKPFMSVTAAAVDLSNIEKPKSESDDETEKEEKADEGDVAKLVLAFKETLGEAVKDVRYSDRLTDSAVCLVAGEGDMDLHLERMLKLQGHMDIPTLSRVLEINPAHPLIKKLTAAVDKPAKKKSVDDMAHLLLDQAKIIEGEPVTDPASFSQRLNAVLEGGL